MALVTKITRILEVPHEPGETITIRHLSARQLEEAREARVNAAIDRMRHQGAELVKVFHDAGREQLEKAAGVKSEDVDAALEDPLNDYDRFTLLMHAVVDWTYEQKVPKNPFDRKELIGELDEVTVDWLAREVLAFSIPDRSEGATKNA